MDKGGAKSPDEEVIIVSIRTAALALLLLANDLATVTLAQDIVITCDAPVTGSWSPTYDLGDDINPEVVPPTDPPTFVYDGTMAEIAHAMLVPPAGALGSQSTSDYQVLFACRPMAAGAGPFDARVFLWSAATGEASAVTLLAPWDAATGDVFCSGHAPLSNGNPFFAGGQDFTKSCTVMPGFTCDGVTFVPAGHAKA